MNLPVGFFGASPGSVELLLVFAVALLLFGPRQLPKLARMIGKALEELRQVSQDFRDQIMSIEDEIESPLTQDSLDAGDDPDDTDDDDPSDWSNDQDESDDDTDLDKSNDGSEDEDKQDDSTG